MCRQITRRMAALVIVVLSQSTLYANTASIDHAVQYLVGQRDPATTLWSVDATRRTIDSMEAIRALLAAENTAGIVAAESSLQQLLQALPDDPQTIAERALTVEWGDGADPQLLLGVQNMDGGWGPVPGKQSDPLDTMLAAHALLTVNRAPAQGWDAVAEYLISCRQPDGFWAFSADGDDGRLELTARIARLLLRLQDNIQSPSTAFLTTLADVLQQLRQALQADGRFSLTAGMMVPPSLIDTAEAYRTLVLVDPPALYTDTVVLLANAQQGSGSWEEPARPEQTIYATAVVLQALTAVPVPAPVPRADLAVFPHSISFAPALPAAGAMVTIRAIVFNLGNLFAENIEVGFYRGDPRSGGILINSLQSVSSISPNGSGVVSTTLDLSDIQEGPLLFVWCDPQKRIPESNQTNNVAFRRLSISGLPDETVADGIDLFLGNTAITFNDEFTNTVFLVNSPTVFIGLTVANVGSQPASQVQLTVHDGGILIGSATIPAVAAGASSVVVFPWNPSSGNHSIHMAVDPQEDIVELNETNNDATTSVEIVGATVAIIVKKIANGMVTDPPFEAYDTARITVATAYRDVDVRVAVTHEPSGAPSSSPVSPLPFAGTYQWNVVNQPPGPYRATAAFHARETGVLMDRVASSFEIVPAVRLRSLRAATNNNIIEGGNILPVPITVTLENGSNMDSQWQVSWELYHPEGYFLFGSTTAHTVSLSAAQLSTTITLPEPVTGLLDASGRYRIVVHATNTNGESMSAETAFNILPILTLNIINELAPSTVPPLDRAKVTTVIKVTAAGEATNLNIPVAIRKVVVDPLDDITDTESASAKIQAIDIVNALGETVADGTPITVYVPYGTLVGGTEPPPSLADPDGFPPNPQVRIFHVVDGAIEVAYHPTGGVLSGASRSLTVLQFHQYLADRSQWFGNNIGNAEILLGSP